MKLIILAGAIVCLSVRQMGCGHEGRPTGCIQDETGARFEYYGLEDVKAKAHCENSRCFFKAYNQGATDDEFETERDVCRPKKPEKGDPVS